MRRAGLAVAAAAVAGAALVSPAQPAYAGDHKVVSTITDERIPESSALVQSKTDPHLAYTINDSGNANVVYVIEIATGDVVGTATIDVAAEDTEAMAIGGDGRLYVADIGDNDFDRRTVALYAIDQPGRGDTTVTPDVYRVRYSDGPSDAETLLVDPATGRMSIVTKNLLAGGVYRLPKHLRENRVNLARSIDVNTPGMVTDGAYLPDGDAVLLRTYIDIAVYSIPGWHKLGSIDTPRMPQSESLAAWNGGRSVLIGTEKLPSPIIQVKVPRHEWRRLHDGPDRDTSGSLSPPTASSSRDDGGISRGWVVASGAALVLLGGGWLWARRGRRSRGTRRAERQSRSTM
ncbi:MAG TPA: hypothetical protein VKB55_04310 [Nocardioidaceae bacterium]|nr:hypothetical protein [Nocardioidaceae bacterium]